MTRPRHTARRLDTRRRASPFLSSCSWSCFAAAPLTGQSQCFYRVSPLAATSDELLLPNLYNVAKAYDQDCWVCLLNMEESLRPLSWSGKVDAIWNHNLRCELQQE